MIRKLYLNLLIFLISQQLFPQSPTISKVEPPNWWIGMKWNKVQLMVYGENLSDLSVFSEDDRLTIDNIYELDNKNYAFIDVIIPPDITEGGYKIVLKNNSGDCFFYYPLKHREENPDHHKGFSGKDIFYLIMADRFCDGDSANNSINSSFDQFTDTDLDGRKGGDINGIISKLDYLKALGVTTLWVTPMLENNMYMSYHGYAATDLYRIDPRFGSNELYKELVINAHQKDLKVIIDHVSNHIGINHPWINNLPSQDWINGKPGDHKPANHNKLTLHDIHSDSLTMSATWEGWFTDYMPDLNQRNPFLKNYLIQNTIWWIEYSGVDGLREDTYPYADQKYLSEWAQAILSEYPDFGIVGEIWTGIPAFLAAYQGNNKFNSEINSNLPSVTDFAFSDALRFYLSGEKGLQFIYETIAQDFLYSDPYKLLTFFDNHDISRGLFVADQNIERFRIALTILLTTRGIPKLLYGTEIGIVGDNKHGNIRSPFPGGFSGDSQNAFLTEERTSYQKMFYDHLANLLHLRNTYPALQSGRLIHFFPFNDQYLYFRILDNQKIMIAVNDTKERKILNLNQVRHVIDTNKILTNLGNGKKYNFLDGDLPVINEKSAEIFLVE